jgi:hypothetical protein
MHVDEGEDSDVRNQVTNTYVKSYCRIMLSTTEIMGARYAFKLEIGFSRSIEDYLFCFA